MSSRDLGLEPTSAGKVRDLFDLGDRLLMVASDRISAYDVILDDPIPGKGILLTQMSQEWFRLLADVVDNHLVSTDLAELPSPFCDHEELAGRSMLVRKAARVDAECIVRGYITGSGWRDYKRTGAVCGIRLPAGLRESEKLEPALFTPSTKADSGHDENIDFEQLQGLVGADVAEQVARASLDIYTRAAGYAREHGILLADSKFEFGFVDGRLTLIDEVLSPDSSRFWPAEAYEVGRSQQSFDKQFVRDWLDSSGWDHTPPPPKLPPDVIEKTQLRYIEALRRLFPHAMAKLPVEARG
jgi:phosphoribosylaminoimidazole-succinocarboxamide synthase